MKEVDNHSERDLYYSSNGLIPVGQYEGVPIDLVVQDNCERCLWFIGQTFMKKNYPKSVDLIRDSIKEIYPKGYEEDFKVIKFGKHEGTSLNELYHLDQDYCFHLVEESWFEEKYPKHFQYLVNLILDDESLSTEEDYSLYILFFHERDYYKIGITRQFLPKRLYSYKGLNSIYREENLKIEKSFYYSTSDPGIEDFLKEALKEFRIERTEKFKDESIQELLKLIDFKIDEGIHMYNWCELGEKLPFKDGFTFFKEFELKANQFHDFKDHYENFLIANGYFDKYECF